MRQAFPSTEHERVQNNTARNWPPIGRDHAGIERRAAALCREMALALSTVSVMVFVSFDTDCTMFVPICTSIVLENLLIKASIVERESGRERQR